MLIFTSLPREHSLPLPFSTKRNKAAGSSAEWEAMVEGGAAMGVAGPRGRGGYFRGRGRGGNAARYQPISCREHKCQGLTRVHDRASAASQVQAQLPNKAPTPAPVPFINDGGSGSTTVE